MCAVVEELAKAYAKEEVAKATAKEIAKAEAKAARAAAQATGEAVDRLIAALHLDTEQACEIMGITVKDYEAYKKQKS